MKTETFFGSTARGAATSAASASHEVGGYRDLIVWLTVTAVSGTLPTLDIVIQHSPDQLNWAPLATIPQVNVATTQSVSIGGVDTPFGQYIRALYTVGGSGTPTVTFSLSVTAKVREVV